MHLPCTIHLIGQVIYQGVSKSQRGCQPKVLSQLYFSLLPVRLSPRMYSARHSAFEFAQFTCFPVTLMHSAYLRLTVSLCLSSLSLSLFNPRETQDPWSGYDYNPLMDSKLVSLSVDLLTYRFSRLALHISLCPALTHSFTQIS